jgi:tRNA(fMet)-specific endonuclease VapC
MPRYLLDTNIIIHYLKNNNSPVGEKFVQIPIQQIYVCSVVKAELFYGAAKSNNPLKSKQVQKKFINYLSSFDFDDNAVEFYADIRASLEKQGTPIGGNDLMIASIALANELILVTANVNEFSRVQNLKIENWLDT